MSSGLERSGTTRKGNASIIVHQSATQKVLVQERKKVTLGEVEQGLKVLYPLDSLGQSTSTDFDIVLVPGLGAHPENSWRWKGSRDGFNWTTEGLVRDFPKARVLLFMYESAWTGPLQVQQFMGNIAKQLLTGLRSMRKDEKRPIVFIGHSMGGIVIARAITMMANMERDDFPLMFEATAACIFFGTPFGGAETAAVAAMYASLAEKLKTAKASKLLDHLKPDNEELRTLKEDFLRLSNKLHPKIDLFCFWEEQETDFAEMAGLPSLFSGLVRLAMPTNLAEFVNRESATLDGVKNMGLACNHRDLIKFSNDKDQRWSQYVRGTLKPIIQGATLNAGKRIKATRGLDATMISDILRSLEGAQPEKKRKNLARTFAPSSWIPKDALYLKWLAPAEKDEERQCLWIRGPEGRGKTGATMAALQEIEMVLSKTSTSQDPVLLAYFFCETIEDYGTAEDLLKSLIRQLISQQQKLAPHAKVFVRNVREKGKDEQGKDKTGKGQVHLTVENLWQVLQDMLNDESIGSRVYFVLNNLHVLPEDAHSTTTLMRYINADVGNSHIHDQQRVSTRWLITSRDCHNIRRTVETENTRLIDLEDEKYGNQVQLELRKHAKKKIDDLSTEKKYNKAIAYFASSLIGKRAQNTQWIDVTCVQLQELSPTETDLKVRQTLETMPRDLDTLLHNSWTQVFSSNADDVEKIKEMLRSLVLTYDDPTEMELAILAGLSSAKEEELEVSKLVQKCKPLLSVKHVSKADVVCFMNPVVKNYLLKDAEALLGLSEDGIKWQHGVLALRTFAHVREAYSSPDMLPESEPAAPNAEGNESSGADLEDGDDDAKSEDDDDSSNDDKEEEEGEDWDEDEYVWPDDESEQKYDREFEVLSEKACHYMVKHWLRHASKATFEIAEDLSQEEDFWSRNSRLRRGWLIVYAQLMSTENWDVDSFTALHVAAAFGYRELVHALIRHGHEDEIKIHDAWHNTPLHLAAWYGRSKIVEELLLKDDTIIDDGAKEENMTPLSMAAHKGKIDVMKKLLLRNADPNTIDGDLGPVINAAIESGNREAVKLLVEEGHVALAIDRDDFVSPLATAALLSDISMFNYLIEKYANKLPDEEYSKALVKSAEAGRVEVFNKLLEFRHQQRFLQQAIDVAAEENKWELVRILLDKGTALDCEQVFHLAATNPEDLTDVLIAVWKYTKGSISSATLNNCLYEATDMEKESTVKLLLQEFKANPNATGEEYGNALTAAAYDAANDGTIVRLLLDAGADPNAVNGYALQAAAAEGHSEVVNELIRRRADVNAITTNENCESGTALQAACEAGQFEIVQLLLQHGGNPNLGCGSASPPIFAAAKSDARILEELIKAKADVNMVGGPDNASALINAAAYLPYESVQILVDAGADVNQQDCDGDTPLIFVAANGDTKSVAYLLDHGADILHSNKNNENALQTALIYGQEDCAKLLADCLSVLFGALKNAMISGDRTITAAVYSMTANFNAMKHIKDDEMVEENENLSETAGSKADHEFLNGQDSNAPDTRKTNQTGTSQFQSTSQEDPEVSGNNHAYTNHFPQDSSEGVSTFGEQVSFVGYQSGGYHNETYPADIAPVSSQYFGGQSQSLATSYSRPPSWEQNSETIRLYQPPPTTGESRTDTMTPPDQQWSRQNSPFDANTRPAVTTTPVVVRRKPTPNTYSSAPPPENLSTSANYEHAAEYTPYRPASDIPPAVSSPQRQSYSYNQSQSTATQPVQQRGTDSDYNASGYNHYASPPQQQAMRNTMPHNASPLQRISSYQQNVSQTITQQSYQRHESAPEQNTAVYGGYGYENLSQYQYQATHMRAGPTSSIQQSNWQNGSSQQNTNYTNGQLIRKSQYNGEKWG